MRSPYRVRFSHGIIPTVERLDAAAKQVDAANRTHSLPYQFAVTGDTSRFDFLFPQLQTERGLLPESYETRDALVDLGMTMTESDHPAPDSLIPSIYTYFGQFVDHDITLEAKSDKVALLSSKTLRPLTSFEMKSNLVNGRKPSLESKSAKFRFSKNQKTVVALFSVCSVARCPRSRSLSEHYSSIQAPEEASLSRLEASSQLSLLHHRRR